MKDIKEAGSIVRVGRNFQVTIPADIRKFVDLSEGDYIKTYLIGHQIVLRPIDIVTKKAKTKKRRADTDDSEEKEWKRFALEEFLQGYDESDSIYDNL